MKINFIFLIFNYQTRFLFFFFFFSLFYRFSKIVIMVVVKLFLLQPLLKVTVSPQEAQVLGRGHKPPRSIKRGQQFTCLSTEHLHQGPNIEVWWWLSDGLGHGTILSRIYHHKVELQWWWWRMPLMVPRHSDMPIWENNSVHSTLLYIIQNPT